MKIQSISSQNFGAKKFRLPITIVDDNILTTLRHGAVNKYTMVDGRFVKEYSNPRAEKLYKKYQNAPTLQEQLKFLEQMGDYSIIDLEKEASGENINIIG